MIRTDEIVRIGNDDVPEQPAAAIRWHEEAAEILNERADEHRWEAARLIVSELDGGKTQRQVAGEIGKSNTHVNFMAQVWRGYQGNQERSFNECYRQVKSRPRPPEIEPAPEPAEAPDSEHGESVTDEGVQSGEGQRPVKHRERIDVVKVVNQAITKTEEAAEKAALINNSHLANRNREAAVWSRRLSEALTELQRLNTSLQEASST